MKPANYFQHLCHAISALTGWRRNPSSDTRITWNSASMKDLAISPNDLPAIVRGTFARDETRRQR